MPSFSPHTTTKREREAIARRDALLEGCGIRLEQRQRVLKKAFKRLEEQLDATKWIASKAGTFETIDNQARLRAIEQVVDFEGVSLGKQHEGQTAGAVHVTINAPFFQPDPTITGGQGQIVEVRPGKALIPNE